MDDVLEKLKVPLNRLHLDGMGGLVVGQERKGRGRWRNYIISEKIRISTNSECWPWLGSVRIHGYGEIRMGAGRCGPGVRVASHRGIFALVFGSIANGLIVRHKCDNPICCNPFHLEPGTNADNTQDMFSRGRSNTATGDRASRRKLWSHQIQEIKALKMSGVSMPEIATKFGVTRQTIYCVITGRSWKKVKN